MEQVRFGQEAPFLLCCVPSLADRLKTKTSDLFPDRIAYFHLENRIFRKKKEKTVNLSRDFLQSVSTRALICRAVKRAGPSKKV